MRFLANENFPGAAVTELRRRGHDVTWVRTDAPGSSDAAVLDRAVAEYRILLTFDKDFGELARNANLPAGSGIVLFRMALTQPAQIGTLLADLIESRSDWPDHFTVIEPGRIRMRPLNRKVF